MSVNNASNSEIAKRTLGKLNGKYCWYVTCGYNVGRSFKLWLGKMVKRENVLGHPGASRIARKAAKAFPKAVRENFPEYGLLVWCSWRLSKKAHGTELWAAVQGWN